MATTLKKIHHRNKGRRVFEGLNEHNWDDFQRDASVALLQQIHPPSTIYKLDDLLKWEWVPIPWVSPNKNLNRKGVPIGYKIDKEHPIWDKYPVPEEHRDCILFPVPKELVALEIAKRLRPKFSFNSIVTWFKNFTGRHVSYNGLIHRLDTERGYALRGKAAEYYATKAKFASEAARTLQEECFSSTWRDKLRRIEKDKEDEAQVRILNPTAEEEKRKAEEDRETFTLQPKTKSGDIKKKYVANQLNRLSRGECSVQAEPGTSNRFSSS